VLSENGTEGQPLDVVSRAGARLREKLGLGAISDAEASGVRASLPSNSESARLYAEGLAKLRVFDATAAHDLLTKAIAADPNFALAHASLSDAWSRLGYDAKAREEVKNAFELSESRSREERSICGGLIPRGHPRVDESCRDLLEPVEFLRRQSGLRPPLGRCASIRRPIQRRSSDGGTSAQAARARTR